MPGDVIKAECDSLFLRSCCCSGQPDQHGRQSSRM